VVARLRLRLESTGRELVYSRRTIADESGRFELRVAHATESDSACAAVALGPYAILREGEVELAAEVPLEAVQTGAKVAVSSSH
jgi:hypothetical protein